MQLPCQEPVPPSIWLNLLSNQANAITAVAVHIQKITLEEDTVIYNLYLVHICRFVQEARALESRFGTNLIDGFHHIFVHIRTDEKFTALHPLNYLVSLNNEHRQKPT